jgi:hypothetical protein
MRRFLCIAEIGVKRISFKMKGMLGLITSASLKASRAAQWFFGFWQVTPDECRNYFFNAGYNSVRPANDLSGFSFGRDYQVHEFAD